MAHIDLSAGTIEYTDTGGEGPVVVLVHGLLMDASLWDGVVADLAPDHRCVIPTLPLGAHTNAVRADADMSLAGIAGLISELLDKLDLHDVTLVGNDTGGLLVQFVMAEGDPRVARAVLASCEAFDNFPPGLPGKTVAMIGKLSPRMFGLFMQQMRLKPVRRLPIAFGRLTKRGDAATKRWMRPLLKQKEIRRDVVGILRAAMRDKEAVVQVGERLRDFKLPALVVWATKDRVMPLDHGRRLAGLLPESKLVEIEDSYTLIALDQPVRLAQEIRAFIATR